MIYFLYGPDSYRRSEKLKEIVDAYKAKHEHADLYVLDCGEDGDRWSDAVDFSGQPSMFSPSKVLVVKDSGEIKEKEWISFLRRNIDTKDIFIFISDFRNPAKEFLFLNDSPYKMEFPELSGRELGLFVEREGKKRGVSFETSALSSFVNLLEGLGDKTWRAISELERFSLLGYGKISLDDFKTHSTLAAKGIVKNETGKILRVKTRGERLRILEKLFLEHGDVLYIFNSLSYQSVGEHAAILADLDISVKSGSLEYEEAVLSFVLGKKHG